MTTEELLASRATLQKIIDTLQAQMDEIDRVLSEQHQKGEANSLQLSRTIKEKTVTRLRQNVADLNDRIENHADN